MQLTAAWEECLFLCYLHVFLSLHPLLLYSCGFGSSICIVGDYIPKVFFYLYKGILLFNFGMIWKEGETAFRREIRGEKMSDG